MINALSFLNRVADRVGYPQIASIEVPTLLSEHRKLVRLLNTILAAIGAYNDWPLLRAEGSIVTVAAIKGDTTNSEFVTATLNNDTVTVANQTFTETLIGQAFQVTGDEYIYRIIAVPSTTQLQLHRAWVNASITVADKQTFTIAMDRYALPTDFDRNVDDWKSFFQPSAIEPRFPNEFREGRRQRQTMLLGEPAFYTKFGMTDNQSAEIMHFDPFPEFARMYNFDYQKKHQEINSDQDKIFYPHAYTAALIDAMVEIIERDYNDSVKFESALQGAIRRHNLQQSNPGPTDGRPRMELRNHTRRSMMVAYGMPSMDIDWGTAFDTGAIFGL